LLWKPVKKSPTKRAGGEPATGVVAELNYLREKMKKTWLLEKNTNVLS